MAKIEELSSDDSGNEKVYMVILSVNLFKVHFPYPTYLTCRVKKILKDVESGDYLRLEHFEW